VFGGETANVTYTVENTGDTDLDSLVLDVTPRTDGVTVADVAGPGADALAANGTVRFGAVASGETVAATVALDVNDTATDLQVVAARATAAAAGESVTRTTTTRLRVEHRVRVRNVTVAPGTIDGGTTASHTVTFDAGKVSDDGRTDMVAVNFPPELDRVSLEHASVTDADGDTVAITGFDRVGTLVMVEVSPETDADLRTLSGEIVVDASAASVATNTTTEVSVSLTDSANGVGQAGVALTVLEDGMPAGELIVGGSAAPAQDPDGDGVFEDVNGDGEVTPGDATVLFRAVFAGDAAVTDNPARFDVNGDGEVTAGDATVLFDRAFGS
jgi:hypothetical protein